MTTIAHVDRRLMTAMAFVAVEAQTVVDVRVGALGVTALLDLRGDVLQRPVAAAALLRGDGRAFSRRLRVVAGNAVDRLRSMAVGEVRGLRADGNGTERRAETHEKQFLQFKHFAFLPDQALVFLARAAA